MKFESSLSNFSQPYSFQIGEKEFFIQEIVDQWYGREHEFYKVRADDGNVYILRHSPVTNEWELEYFKKETCSATYIS